MTLVYGGSADLAVGVAPDSADDAETAGGELLKHRVPGKGAVKLGKVQREQ